MATTVPVTNLRWDLFALSRRLGAGGRWLLSEWRRPLLWLAALATVVWFGERVSRLPAGVSFSWWSILTVFAFAALLWWAWQARKRVVIEEFTHHAGGESKPDPLGLGALLAVELAQLRELYRVVDEKRAIPTNVGVEAPLDAAIKAEDVSEFLKTAVSAESKLSLGPLQLPVGAFMALFGRVVQGPRIVGSLHRDDQSTLTLTARIIGGKRSASWRVDGSCPLAPATGTWEQRANAMVTELAYRVFTDLAIGEGIRWRAIWKFSEGLRAYRACLRTPKDRRANLQRAADRLVEAVAEDQEFDLAHYNLGVVYTELGQVDTAEIVFLEAMRKQPGQWRSAYALAHLGWIRGTAASRESCIRLCRRVIGLRPRLLDRARAFNLKGLAERLQECPEALETAVRSRERAATLAWRALILAALKGERVAEARAVAGQCVQSLAVAYAYQADKEAERQRRRSRLFRRTEVLLRQAMELAPTDGQLPFELGKVYAAWNKPASAAEALEAAIRIDPLAPAYWAHLASAYAKLGRLDQAEDACARALDCLDPADGSTRNLFDLIATTYATVGQPDEGERVRGMPVLFDETEVLWGRAELAPDHADGLRARLAEHHPPSHFWERARLAGTLGSLCLVTGKEQEAERHFSQAIALLEVRYPQEIRRRGLRILLARSLRQQGRHTEALAEAERALALDSLSAFAREEIGQFYFGLHEYAHARDAWKGALLCEPNDPNIHFDIAFAHLRLLDDARDAARRKEAREQAVSYFQKALELDAVPERGRTHYQLGRLHFVCGDYEQAMPHFRIASVLGFSPAISQLLLADALLRHRAYEACVEEYHRVIALAEERLKAGATPDAIVDRESAEGMSLGAMLGWALRGLAFSYAERDARGRLDEAAELVGRAMASAAGLPEGAERTHLEAACADCEGWIACKQDRLDDAVVHLERAVSLMADAEIYLHLALVYERKAEQTQDAVQAAILLRRVRAAARQARDLDLEGELTDHIDELLARIPEETGVPARSVPKAEPNVDGSQPPTEPANGPEAGDGVRPVVRAGPTPTVA